jgi:hypothetical protein
MDLQFPPFSLLPLVPFIVLCLLVALAVWIVRGYLRNRR